MPRGRLFSRSTGYCGSAVRVAVTLVIAITGACARQVEHSGPPGPSAQIPASGEDQIIRHVSFPIAREAFWGADGNTIFIRYEADGRFFFAMADRLHEQNVSPHGQWESVVYAQPSDAQAFAKRQPAARPLSILGVQYYREFVLRVADRLVPPEPEAGVLLNRADKEFFFYRDQAGSLQLVTGMVNKPAKVPLIASYRIETLSDLVAGEADAYLMDLGIEDDRVLISTGESGPYARPFAIFDRTSGQRIFISLEPFRFGTVETNIVEQTGKTAWNVGRSYWWDFWNRPVSHISRGVIFALDTVRDAGRDVTIRLLQFPELDDDPILPLEQGPGMDIAAWERFLDETFGEQTYAGQAQILIDGDQFFPRLIDSIQNADRSIKIRTYIFDNDDFALGIADLLRQRSADLKVQVMLDSLGTQFAQTESPATLPEGAETAAAIMHHLELGSKVNVRPLTNPWLTGDHSKSMTIDGRVAYVGGMNIGREYRWEWHDLMVKLTGRVAAAVDYEFDKTWAHATMAGDLVYPAFLATSEMDQLPLREGDYPIRILTTLPMESQILRAQIHAIRRAKSAIWVENAYFSSTRVLFELAKARHRGVDVRVILPVEGDNGIMDKNNVQAANTLLKHGARVFIYPGMSHVKAAIYDDWACLGSANFDKLSFRVNKELNLGISHAGFVDRLREEVFEADMARSLELTEPLPEDFSHTLASIFASQL
ncbi:MAG: phosphatidylserine/phosphatidylglycerophosphate/cardiolipin synthase family protein [Gammaproteobacteria bacterium]|nr:MAG: phosphatidylserine/phosphatidylglycerophosphate/cardiolipin synthase family protein [Gammaproteobacteria bacterium]